MAKEEKNNLTDLEKKTRGLTPVEKQGLPDKEFNKVITVNVSDETYELWEKWKKRVQKATGFDNDSKAMEFALVEAINTPKESTK